MKEHENPGSLHVNLRRAAQTLTVAFAISMLAAYVAYASKQRNRSQEVMPSSKLRMLNGAEQQQALEGHSPSNAAVTPLAAKPAGTTNAPTNVITTLSAPTNSRFVASSSKFATVFTPPSATPVPTNSSATNVRNRIIAYGSKSAPAFTPQDVSLTNSNPPAQHKQ